MVNKSKKIETQWQPRSGALSYPPAFRYGCQLKEIPKSKVLLTVGCQKSRYLLQLSFRPLKFFFQN